MRKVRRTSVDLDDRAEDDFAGFDDDGGDSAVEEVVVAPVNKRKKGKKAAKEALPLPELKTVYEGGTVKLQVSSHHSILTSI